MEAVLQLTNIRRSGTIALPAHFRTGRSEPLAECDKDGELDGFFSSVGQQNGAGLADLSAATSP